MECSSTRDTLWIVFQTEIIAGLPEKISNDDKKSNVLSKENKKIKVKENINDEDETKSNEQETEDNSEELEKIAKEEEKIKNGEFIFDFLNEKNKESNKTIFATGPIEKLSTNPLK